ncbi:putative ABC-type multidrug/protein/lipid transport system ATPase component [Clostridium sp. CAG:138]|nr:putative ABC-type multidrug/protein/lipid transport system ATPase component [Clostridium sp. CAG:138]
MKNGRTKNDSSGNCAAENEKANAAKENMGALCKKPLEKQLRGQFFYKNIPIFCLAVFAALAAGSLNLILSWIIQQLMDTAAGKSGALSFRTLLLISAGFVLLCAGLSLLNYASQPRFLERAMRQYKDFAFKKLIGKSISSFRDESAAGYLSALTNDAASIETNYLAQMLAMITKAVTFIGALLLMCRYSLLMTAIAAGLTVLPLIASLLTGNRLQAVESRVSERNGEFTAALSDCLAGFTVVKNFKAEREIFRLFAQSNKALEHEKFTGRRIKTLVGMIGAVTGIFAQLGVFIAGVYLSMKGGSMTPGAVVLFVNLMNFIISPIAELPGLLACRKAALGLVDKLAAALERSSSREGSETLNRLEHGIRLENVSFAYEPGKTVLHGINAEFEAGRAYALVGGSGSGKSTLLNLLMAAETNYSGHILADGIELSDISTESLYGTMAAIQQNVFVFNASIKDNVSMFRDFPKTEMDEAIARAHLGALIRERGEDYLCGENGSGLSGGEKQRISIARSLLKKSSVLLADEVTAALDAQTAHRVSSDILDLQGITRIVVTHTLEESLLRRYDKIFVLRGGRIEEAGSFADLMANKGYFYALFTVAQ